MVPSERKAAALAKQQLLNIQKQLQLQHHQQQQQQQQQQKQPAVLFVRRSKEQERAILQSFLVDGIDQEDINFFKRTYEQMCAANVDSNNNNNSEENELTTLVMN